MTSRQRIALIERDTTARIPLDEGATDQEVEVAYAAFKLSLRGTVADPLSRRVNSFYDQLAFELSKSEHFHDSGIGEILGTSNTVVANAIDRHRAALAAAEAEALRASESQSTTPPTPRTRSGQATFGKMSAHDRRKYLNRHIQAGIDMQGDANAAFETWLDKLAERRSTEERRFGAKLDDVVERLLRKEPDLATNAVRLLLGVKTFGVVKDSMARVRERLAQADRTSSPVLHLAEVTPAAGPSNLPPRGGGPSGS